MDIRNAEYKNGSFQFPPQYWITLDACNGDYCKKKFGYLDVNEIVPLHFTFNNKKIQIIKVYCSNQLKSVSIRS